MKNILILTAVILLSITGCKKEDTDTLPPCQQNGTGTLTVNNTTAHTWTLTWDGTLYTFTPNGSTAITHAPYSGALSFTNSTTGANITAYPYVALCQNKVVTL